MSKLKTLVIKLLQKLRILKQDAIADVINLKDKQ